MPVEGYYGGKGEEVMQDMKSRYKSPKKAKQVFYATANKNPKLKPKKASPAMPPRGGMGVGM